MLQLLTELNVITLNGHIYTVFGYSSHGKNDTEILIIKTFLKHTTRFAWDF